MAHTAKIRNLFYTAGKEKKMLQYSIFQWVGFFILYCYIGWLGESIYVSLEHKKWVNRGFLHGPFLPIYGFGAIIILFSTLPVRDNVILTFLLGMLGATVLEYVTGYVMEQLFHVKYWDYTYEPLNLNGYICLGCSLTWGICAILLTQLIHKPVERFLLHIPNMVLSICDMVFIGYFIWDVIASAQEAFDLKKMILANEDVQRLQKRLDVIIAVAEDDKARLEERIAEIRLEKRAEIEYIMDRLEAAGERMKGSYGRSGKRAYHILKRNPGATSKRHGLDFDAIREIIGKLIDK